MKHRCRTSASSGAQTEDIKDKNLKKPTKYVLKRNTLQITENKTHMHTHLEIHPSTPKGLTKRNKCAP